jgi:hypothetical protein
VIRSVLSSGLESHISFAKSFVRCVLTFSGVIIHFSDGKTAEGILLVGADGVKSKVRRQLVPEQKLVDTEGRYFFGKTPLTPKFLERFNKAAAGLSIVQDTRKELPLSCLLEPMRFRDNEYRKDLPRDYVYWVFGSMKPFFGQDDSQLLSLTRETAAIETMRLTKNWDGSFRVLFEL